MAGTQKSSVWALSVIGKDAMCSLSQCNSGPWGFWSIRHGKWLRRGVRSVDMGYLIERWQGAMWLKPTVFQLFTIRSGKPDNYPQQDGRGESRGLRISRARGHRQS